MWTGKLTLIISHYPEVTVREQESPIEGHTLSADRIERQRALTKFEYEGNSLHLVALEHTVDTRVYITRPMMEDIDQVVDDIVASDCLDITRAGTYGDNQLKNRILKSHDKDVLSEVSTISVRYLSDYHSLSKELNLSEVTKVEVDDCGEIRRLRLPKNVNHLVLKESYVASPICRLEHYIETVQVDISKLDNMTDILNNCETLIITEVLDDYELPFDRVRRILLYGDKLPKNIVYLQRYSDRRGEVNLVCSFTTDNVGI